MPLQFSTSQQQLIRLLAEGYADSEIAHKMALSRDQLQRAFSDLCDQLNVADRIELILLLWSSDGFRPKRSSQRTLRSINSKKRTEMFSKLLGLSTNASNRECTRRRNEP